MGDDKDEKKSKLVDIINKSLKDMESIERSHNEALTQFNVQKYQIKSHKDMNKLLKEFGKHILTKVGMPMDDKFILGYMQRHLMNVYGDIETAYKEIAKGDIIGVLSKLKEAIKNEALNLYHRAMIQENYDLTSFNERLQLAKEFMELGKQYNIPSGRPPEELALKPEQLIYQTLELAKAYHEATKKPFNAYKKAA